jgi:hypothetical protein
MPATSWNTNGGRRGWDGLLLPLLALKVVLLVLPAARRR